MGLSDQYENEGTAQYRVACDVGGTFTDVCFLDEKTGKVHVAKTPTTPDPIDGIFEGIKLGGVQLKDVALFSHGTTLATNALITRRFPPALMITTKGFRDVIEIRRGTRDDCWDAYKEMAQPYIRRSDRLVIDERIDYSGKVLKGIDRDDAAELCRIIKKRDVTNIAICLVNSFTNPENEGALRDIILSLIPDATISLSSDIMPEIFEHERFNTTVANAVLSPVAGAYCSALQKKMEERGYREDVLLLHSGGGVMTAAGAKKFPARMSASGIAAGAIASRFIARLVGFENSISLDMGGTSTDISLVDRGELPITNDWHVEYGYPIRFPSVEVLTIGAGGGSLAWIDRAGSLRNGPQSAGATPGPVCYNRGGTEPTNTDANVFLGRLGTKLAGGTIDLDSTISEGAICKNIADPLKIETEDAAISILQVANANMSDAVRLVSIRKGYDPRDFALVAFGGAGALHGAALSKDLNIPTVLIPPNPGITSALGCLLVDITHDISRMYLSNVKDIQVDELNSAFLELEKEGFERLSNEGVSQNDMIFQRVLDMRYLGQWRSMSVNMPSNIRSLDDAISQFHEEHGREHNYSRPGAEVEVYKIQVNATGLTPKAEIAVHEIIDSPLPEPHAYRDIRFDEEEKRVSTPIFLREELHPGACLDGPAVIEQLDSTILIPPGFVAEVDKHLIIKMQQK